MNVAVEINTRIEAVAIDAIDEIHVAVVIDVVASRSRSNHSRSGRVSGSGSGVIQAEGGNEEPLWFDASREGLSCTNHLVA